MNKKLITALLFFSAIGFQCKKGTNSKIDVTGITQTDFSGNALSQADNTDWIQDNTWTADELALFQTPTSSQLANTQTAIISVLPAFPNPCAGVINFTSDISKFTLLQLVITDNMLSVKDRFFAVNTNVNLNLLKLNLDAAKYSNNTNYRIYYGFYSLTAGLYFKGHGDIKIVR